LAVEIMI